MRLSTQTATRRPTRRPQMAKTTRPQNTPQCHFSRCSGKFAFFLLTRRFIVSQIRNSLREIPKHCRFYFCHRQWCSTGRSNHLSAAATLTSSLFAKPLMSLLFGEVSNDFIKYRSTILDPNSGTAGSPELLSQAAAAFKRSAGRNALWITVVGKAIHFST